MAAGMVQRGIGLIKNKDAVIGGGECRSREEKNCSVKWSRWQKVKLIMTQIGRLGWEVALTIVTAPS